ncbi:MAG TPA: CdaR family protein [Trueperaceae bacterium]|nr:CdaR family protein [Trueperaceae bacterium]
MSGAWATLKAILGRLARNWPTKLAAVGIALLLWLFVTNSSTTTTQRSLLLPLSIEGVGPDQVAVGLPSTVAVSVSGPSSRVNRLTPEMLRATLDLNEISGSFEQPITVQAPQEIDVESVEPALVIGFLESITSSSLAVQVALTGQRPPSALVEAAATPTNVTLTGRSQALDSVQRVVAIAPAIGGGIAAVVALDAEGDPVPGVTIEPGQVTVAVTTREALVTKPVAIEFEAPSAPTLASANLSSDSVVVAGDEASLGPLTSVTATVEAPTGPVDPGRYTLPVRLDLPEGVVALSTPTVTLQYVREPLQP